MIRAIPVIIVLIIFFLISPAQDILQPNVALKSHETLELNKVELTKEKVIAFFSIENRIEGGNFCADRNIYLVDSDGRKLKLRKSSGIPVCPTTYKFKSIGEVLQFSLEFPALKSGSKWFDIVEDCSENCFSLYGVTIDVELNEKMNEAYSYVTKGETRRAIELYINILNTLPDADQGIKGALYSSIISLSNEAGDKSVCDEWFKKMAVSNAPRLELYIQNLKLRGIVR